MIKLIYILIVIDIICCVIMHIIDISMKINEKMLTYPNNPKPIIKGYSFIPKDKTNESFICMGSHTGTHVDSMLHVFKNGNAADTLPLNSLYGSCKVIDLTCVGREIKKEHLMKCRIGKNDILLLKTENSKKQYKRFRKDFAYVSMDAAKYLVKSKIKTLGIDYLSIKRFGMDDEVHRLIIKNMTLFEGLYLKDVFPGRYLFIGLPLKLHCDGAPARAILVKR